MSQLKIIVVDDEPFTCDAHAEALLNVGHHVRQAGDVMSCREAMNSLPADIIILDLGLPGVDGMSFAAELRKDGKVGVIVVTGRADLETRMTALRDGADDYLVKPIHLGELCLRVDNLARLMQRAKVSSYRLGQWTMDLSKRTLTSTSAVDIELTRGEFDLLVKLVEAGGKIVSRDSLSVVVHRGAGESDGRAVDALVSRLRRKLRLNNFDGPAILTAPGFGYRIDSAAL